MFVERGQIWEAPLEAVRITPEDQDALAQRAYVAARAGFSFCYESNRRLAFNEGRRSAYRVHFPSALSEFLSLLNQESTLDLFRGITGVSELSSANAQASRFRSGHFLSFHDDAPVEQRRIAYVLNLTPVWNAAWGGLLQFMAPDGSITETYVPQFNALHVFRVPQRHGVSYVTPYAAHPRYAISGWLHAKGPGDSPLRAAGETAG